MGLNFGLVGITDLFLGTTRPQAVYYGTVLVWPLVLIVDIITGGFSSPAFVDFYDGGTASLVYTDVVSGGSSAS